MFRLQNHVPAVYAEKSRDFQLFCRLYDACFGSVKYSIDSLSRISSTKECDSRVLELLKTKLGLFTSVSANTRELRYLLQAFPTLIRYKGCKQGVEYIKVLYTKMYSGVVPPAVEYDNINYSILLTFQEQPKNDKLLLELFRYVLPTGYTIRYQVASMLTYRSILTTQDKVIYDTNDTVSKILPNTTILTDLGAAETELGAVVGLSDIEIKAGAATTEPVNLEQGDR